jgi:hypothetical protein
MPTRSMLPLVAYLLALSAPAAGAQTPPGPDSPSAAATMGPPRVLAEVEAWAGDARN